MSSQQIQALLLPPAIEESNRKTTLFLNTRFQSLEDLDDLERFIVDAQNRDNELKSNLSSSHVHISAVLSQTRASTERHRSSAHELSLSRHSLSDELSGLAQELISSMSSEDRKPTLLEDIETLHRNLKELQSIKSYVQIIEHALKLSEAVSQLMRTPNILINDVAAGYKSIEEFVAKVSNTFSQVEDGNGKQTLNLVEFLEQVREKTWGDMKGVLSGVLLAAAEKLGWPMPVDYISSRLEDRKEFEIAFLNLLELQSIGEKIRTLSVSPKQEKDGLYPLQSLVQPFSMRFKYHFEGSRQTNKLDKPEWYFTHVLNVVHEQRLFMESPIQSLLSKTQYRGINAWCEFTYLLLPLLSRKLKHTVPYLVPHPSLLAHTIYQALVFDAALAEEGFQIGGTTSATKGQVLKWNGVSDVILGNKEWFDAWVLGEQKFAEEQYQEIIGATDAWLIADDDGDSENSNLRDLKSTTSARRIKALVEQVTDRYSPLPHFRQRTRFLISVQIPLLEQYHTRISSSLDAFETLSSAFVRAVPGALGVSLSNKDEARVNIDTRRLTSGIEGVQRLCKALLSAKYIEVAMEEWGEDLFFLELWTEINHRASLRVRAEANPSLPDPSTTETEIPQDTIFEELVLQYRKLIARAEDMIVQQVCIEVESELKAHFNSDLSLNEGTDDIMLSQTLLKPIALFSSHLTLFRTTLPQMTITTLYRRIASRLAEHILQREILYRGHVSLSQGKVISAECELWVETCHAALSRGFSGGRNRIEAPWLKLLQAGRLIGADGDVWKSVVDATFQTQSEEDWEAAMVRIAGSTAMSRDEVGRILRSREE